VAFSFSLVKVPIAAICENFLFFWLAALTFFYLHTQVGEDEFGYMLANILKDNNVNNDGMRFDSGARTALAFVTLRKDGEREFMFYRNPSADMLLQESELDFDLIKKVFEVCLFPARLGNQSSREEHPNIFFCCK